MRKILYIIILAAWFLTCCYIEGSDITRGADPREEVTIPDTLVQVLVTLPDGNVYIVDEYTTEVQISGNQANPETVQIIQYRR